MADELSLTLAGRLKHGDLWKAMTDRGWTQTKLGEFLGMGQAQVGALLNMRWVPKEANPTLESRLFELTGKLPDELWPEWSRAPDWLAADKRICVSKEVTPAMLAAGGWLKQLSASPDALYTQEELREKVKEVLGTLTPREQRVIRLRFGLDGGGERTLHEIGRDGGLYGNAVTAHRIRQIEAKAMRKLRHPRRSKHLRPYDDTVDQGFEDVTASR